MNLYKIAKSVVALIFYPLYRIKVIGKENVPNKGPVIICSNHISNLDPPVVGITSPRDISFMAKDELFEKPFIGWLLSNIQAFPVKRGMSDRNALRKGLATLKDGHTLGLFPEGTRSKTGELGEPLSGAGFFALRSDAVIVPCAIIGTYQPLKQLKVVYGQPIPMEELRTSKATAKETADVIMSEIKKLIDFNK
ncbi:MULTISPECIES: lysophospholipid acyltransferase family protein [Virgibacillus]|uniref:1-acyl-sn-glycerol-3-phosphate acyltransferase n=2 Tax=Virgibacillus TaxID=84406 RepID=A0A024QBA6_9BACI|nr:MULTISPECIES: lysophospholipid acyltransferase family protein [Virgibacillus]EQB36094.1 1-acyl-sn-glycerol-3-phosphate acyltransferase [Virgibacillus sp. CM-4]GGJ46719.1 1-acyl-sn-glycerol-3-phosphate acyltransferase [Virgibacillus kapii]CDQ39789.1 1-acyl-sn-glycerol-3-phosphate acyltransferase [Virgibacillus massiliensis]